MVHGAEEGYIQSSPRSRNVASDSLSGFYEEPLAAHQALSFSSGPIIIVLASVTLIAQSSFDCAEFCPGKTAYAVAVGAISAATVIVCIFAMQLSKYLSVFLVVWWIPAVATCTFWGPYKYVSNGYLACWAGLFGSFLLCREAAPELGVHKIMTQMAASSDSVRLCRLGLLIASFVAMCASAAECSDYGCTDYRAWAVSCSTISLFIALLYQLPFGCQQIVASNMVNKALLALLCLLWIPGVITMTMKAPFVVAGNGFFSSWGSAL